MYALWHEASYVGSLHHPRVVEWLAAVESAARRRHVTVGALLWKDNSVQFCILLVTKHL